MFLSFVVCYFGDLLKSAKHSLVYDLLPLTSGDFKVTCGVLVDI